MSPPPPTRFLGNRPIAVAKDKGKDKEAKKKKKKKASEGGEPSLFGDDSLLEILNMEMEEEVEKEKEEESPGIIRASQLPRSPPEASVRSMTSDGSPVFELSETSDSPAPGPPPGASESSSPDRSLTSEEMLELRHWGLPELVRLRYARKGIERMFPWQCECLREGGRRNRACASLFHCGSVSLDVPVKKSLRAQATKYCQCFNLALSWQETVPFREA